MKVASKFFLYPYQEGEIVELKKQHPCGSRRWKVLRTGADIKLECLGCAHILNLSRTKIEKMTKHVLKTNSEDKADGSQ